MHTRKLALAGAILACTSAHAQFGMESMMNPMAMGMMNPAMLMNPLTMGMMNPAMMSPMGGFGGMNPAQYMANPYLNPTSSLMPFLSTPSPMGNPYLMPPPQPKQPAGFFPYMPAQAAPAAPRYGAPQASYFPMTPSAVQAPVPTYGYGYGMPAPAPAAPAATPNMGSFMPFFPVMPAPQAAPPVGATQATPQPAAATPAATNMFDAAAWSRMFPSPATPSTQASPAAPAPAAAAQPAPATAPNYLDPNMWMQWMAPAAPK